MSDANRTLLSYKKETTFGTAPTGAYQEVRHTGETLGQETSSVRSQEIRADRQTPDIIRVDVGAVGGYNIEFSARSHDEMMAAALFSAGWSSPTLYSNTDVSTSSVDNSINSAGAGFAGFAAGQWVATKGFTNAANNGIFKITQVVSTSKIIVAGAAPLVTEAAGALRAVCMMSQIVNGISQGSYAFERHFQDLTNEFAINEGLTPNTFELSVTAKQIATGAFGFMGTKERSAAAQVKSSLTAAPTNRILNAVDNVYRVYDNMAAVDVAKVGFNIANNLRARNIVALLGPESIGSGTCEAKGQIEVYYKIKTLIDKHLNFNQAALAWLMYEPNAFPPLVNSTDNSIYVFEFPAIRYTSGKRNAGGINTDIMALMNFEAFRHPTEGVTVRIARLLAGDMP